MSLRGSSRPLLATIGVCAALAGPGLARAAKFDGFNERFNLGLSAASGAVCEANRAFDDDLVSKGARVWNVTCRGWSHRLGRLYLFPSGGASAAESLWRKELAATSDCAGAISGAAGSDKPVACKLKPGDLQYVVFAPGSSQRVAAEGMAPIADLLAGGLKYMDGRAPEPEAVAQQSANVSQVAGVRVEELAAVDAAKQTADQRRRLGYESGHEWLFGEAENAFGSVAGEPGEGPAGAARQAEALFNLALNVSNSGRFDEAQIYFAQAQSAEKAAGDDPALRALGLNDLAADARNRRRYADAIAFADQAIEARRGSVNVAAVERTSDGSVRITDVGAPDVTQQVSATQREQLRDAQALEIKATSLEALGRFDEARQAIDQAIAILDRPFAAGGANGPRLGEATPWLNTEARADAMRLYAGAPAAPNAERDFRAAVAAFGRKHPNSLPLAGYLVELARAEAASAGSGANGRTPGKERALADYESAFAIFTAQRGSLEASADLVRPYFDILLRRIASSAPDPDAADVGRFFTGAQTLVFQSSAEAAKRQAARTLAGGEKAAGLARALDDTSRELDAANAKIRDLRQQDAYKGPQKAALDAQVKALTSQSATLEAQLLEADPHYASLLRKSVNLAELQGNLEAGEVYVKAFVLSGRGYGLMVTHTAAKAYPIDLTREKAKALVAAYREPIDQLRVLSDGRASPRRFDVATAHVIFETLLGPVRDQVLSAKHLIWEPDATLIGAPVAAFVIDDKSIDVMNANLEKARSSDQPLTYAGVAWLASKVPVTTALSATAFVQARESRKTAAVQADNRKLFLGFGDPIISASDPRTFADVQPTGLRSKEAEDYCHFIRTRLMDLPPLPETAVEVTQVAEKTLGQDDPSARRLGPAFTDGDILRRGTRDGDLSHYKVLYFATHGILPQRNGCLQAALLTSLDSTDGDGLLDERKIPQLNLNADMVVLSACDTGTKGDVNGGEALGGLVSTFVQAGARNVVVSNWEVDTKASIRLMESMFAHHGESQAEALADAERDLMNSPDQYSHPYFWAPFTVVGDGALAMPGN